MAPILISYDPVEEIAEPVTQTPPKRRLKPIVPVVPRIFERKQRKSAQQHPASSSPITGREDHGVEVLRSPVGPRPVEEHQDIDLEPLVVRNDGASEVALDELPAATDVHDQGMSDFSEPRVVNEDQC